MADHVRFIIGYTYLLAILCTFYTKMALNVCSSSNNLIKNKTVLKGQPFNTAMAH